VCAAQIDWSTADPSGQVNNPAKKIALEAIAAYQKGSMDVNPWDRFKASSAE